MGHPDGRTQEFVVNGSEVVKDLVSAGADPSSGTKYLKSERWGTNTSILRHAHVLRSRQNPKSGRRTPVTFPCGVDKTLIVGRVLGHLSPPSHLIPLPVTLTFRHLDGISQSTLASRPHHSFNPLGPSTRSCRVYSFSNLLL